MVDEPSSFNEDLNETLCRTLQPIQQCQDCRETAIEDIFSTHFTVCGKPEWCILEHQVDLCMQLFYKWHQVRYSLEQEWEVKYAGYRPNVHTINVTSNSTEMQRVLANLHGHCSDDGYRPLLLPENVTEKLL